MRLSATSTTVASKSIAAAAGVSLPDYLTNTDDLIYYIDFHNTDSYSGSGTSITDLSASGFTTTITGTAGSNWQYISSDDESSNPAFATYSGGASDGWITASTSSSADFDFGTEDFSIEMWLRGYSGIGGMVTIVDTFKNTSGDSVDGDPKAYMCMDIIGRNYGASAETIAQRGKFRVRMRDFNGSGNGDNQWFTSSTWPGYSSGSNAWGDWFLATLVRDGTSVKLYQNGTEVISETTSSTYNFHSSNDAVLQILRDYGDTDIARLGACRVYKGAALSSSDITAHYNGEKADYGY